MNFRVFLLFAAMAAFAGLWASDGRYQAEQIALARIERARNSNVIVLAAIASRPAQAQADERAARLFANMAVEARAATVDWVIPSLGKLLMSQGTQPVRRDADERVESKVVLGRLVIAWTLGFDPGPGMSALDDQASLAQARFEERFCLLRFRTRQAAFYASRRVAAFLRAQVSDQQQPGRMARIIIREIPIEETQAPPAGGRQTR
jgi:hypothetical protein